MKTPDNALTNVELEIERRVSANCYQCGAPLLEEDGTSPSCGSCVDIERRMTARDEEGALTDARMILTIARYLEGR